MVELLFCCPYCGIKRGLCKPFSSLSGGLAPELGLSIVSGAMGSLTRLSHLCPHLTWSASELLTFIWWIDQRLIFSSLDPHDQALVAILITL